MSSTTLTIPGIQDAKKLALITPESASAVVVAYSPHFTAFLELEEKAKLIAVNAPVAAKRMRLDLRKVRVEADKSRKTLGEEGRRYVEAVNEVYNLLESRLSPIEERMESIEKAEERAEAERKAAIKAARLFELLPYGQDNTFYDLANLPEVQYLQLRDSQKMAHEAKQAAVLKAEQDRVAAETAKETERLRLKTENDRLAKEAADAKRAKDEADRKAEETRKAAEAEKAKLKAESDAQLAAQVKAAADEAARLKKVNDDKLAKEAADRAAQEKVAQAERDRLKAIEDAKAKATLDAANREIEAANKKAQDLAKAEAQRKANEVEVAAKVAELARKAAAAPEKERLLSFAKVVRALSKVNPKLKTEAGIALAGKIEGQIAKFATWVEGEAAKL